MTIRRNSAPEFSPYIRTEWQYVSLKFSKSKRASVRYISIYCEYEMNACEAYFERNEPHKGLHSSTLDFQLQIFPEQTEQKKKISRKVDRQSRMPVRMKKRALKKAMILMVILLLKPHLRMEHMEPYTVPLDITIAAVDFLIPEMTV